MSPADKQMLADFFSQLRNAPCASQHTIISYQCDINRLLQYCADHAFSHWADVKQNDLDGYIKSRHRSGVSNKSVQRELSAIRRFYNYLIKNKLIDINPAHYVKVPKAQPKLSNILNINEVNAILDAQARSHLEIRDLAMFELFYSSGLRLSELTKLNVIDLSVTDRSLKITSEKEGKIRLLPIGGHAIKALLLWLTLRPTIAKMTETALFVSQLGTRLGQRSIQIRLKQWCRKNAIEDTIYPHKLRHSLASHLLEASGDLRAIQELLGHSNSHTMQMYTQLNFQYVAAAYNDAHPRAKKRHNDTGEKQKN